MWILKHPSAENLDTYTDKLLEPLITSLNDSGIVAIKNVLLPMNNGKECDEILRKLLIIKPEELYLLNHELMRQLVVDYNEAEFENYLSAKNKKEENRNQVEKDLITKYSGILSDLNNIFNYEKKISSSKSKSYWISGIKGRNSCTYCNRQYTQTIIREGGTNDKNRISRPELDHWFSKELHPLMSLSYFNLIPSCSICNSTAKGNAIFNLATHIHPYIPTSSNPDFKFSFKVVEDNKWEVIVVNDTNPKEKKMLEEFHIEEVYKFHSDLELKDILDFSLKNNKTYLNTIYNHTLKRFPSKTPTDVYRMLFGVELDEAEFLNRPMSKFKHDILKELKIVE